MADIDPELGMRLHEELKRRNLETPMTDYPGLDLEGRGNLMRLSQFNTMRALGLNLEDDSLAGTPRRVAKMYQEELFYGLDYNNFPKISVFKNKANYDEMLAVSCTVQSSCEHHFLPFIGTAHVAYIPGAKFLGLSKFNRVVDFYSRRPQVQERLTEQISAVFRILLETEDVAVVIKAEHYCVKLRGVKDSCNETITSKLCGKFRDVPELRSEFISLTRV